MENDRLTEKLPVFEEHEESLPSGQKKPRSVPPKTLLINAHDSSLNCLVDIEGNILSSIHADGLGSLLAQARANHGIKKGRYYYEVTVMEAQQHQVFRLGFSTLNAKFVGAENSVCFTNLYRFRCNGEVGNPVKGVGPFQKDDIIGVLLNLDAKSKNKNTLALFVNGKRASEPQLIPESMLKGPLYPHVAFRGCSLGLHFEHQQKMLPFTVCMIGNAQPADIEKSPICAVDNPKATYPVGVEMDAFVNDFIATNIGVVELSTSYFDQWCKESSFSKKGDNFYGIAALDNPQHLAIWMRVKRRNAIIALGTSLFPNDRASKLEIAPDHDKECIVLPITPCRNKIFNHYMHASLPSDDEGFVTVSFQTSRDIEEANLAVWMKDQKLRTKVDGLKTGPWFHDRLGEWAKYVKEKMSTEEGKQFSDEDWMLANLRAEMVHIVQAFKDDVADEERPSFPPALYETYYKVYSNKTFNPTAFACTSIETLLSEHLTDCMEIDDKGLLSVKLEKDVPIEKIWELVDVARERRETRVGSGDDLFDLKFTSRGAKRLGKGGLKRPIPFGAPANAQRLRRE